MRVPVCTSSVGNKDSTFRFLDALELILDILQMLQRIWSVKSERYMQPACELAVVNHIQTMLLNKVGTEKLLLVIHTLSNKRPKRYAERKRAWTHSPMYLHLHL
jgi:hypothetical protein